MSMYEDLVKNRPTREMVVKEVAYLGGNTKVHPKEVINALYKAEKDTRFTEIWVDFSSREDEWGHTSLGGTLVVMGKRPATDEEWAQEIEHAFNNEKNDKERHEMHHKYFTNGRHDEIQKSFTDKIKELRGKRKG